MKLRLRGNSLRLRLTQTEVITLRDTGVWRTSTALNAEATAELTYSVEAAANGKVEVGLRQGTAGITIAVSWPETEIRTWAETEIRTWADTPSVGLYHETAWGLKIAVEKDFRCLDPSRDEDESDNFENPGAGENHHAACGHDD